MLQLDHVLGHPAGDAAVKVVLELLPPVGKQGDQHQGVGDMGEQLLDHLAEAEQYGSVALQPKTLQLVEDQDQGLIKAAEQAEHTQGLQGELLPQLLLVPGAEAFQFTIHRLVLTGGQPAAAALAAAGFAVAAEAQQTLEDLTSVARGAVVIGPPAQQDHFDPFPALAAGVTPFLPKPAKVFSFQGREDLAVRSVLVPASAKMPLIDRISSRSNWLWGPSPTCSTSDSRVRE